MIPNLAISCLLAIQGGLSSANHFGLRLCSVGDIDGDHVPDWLIGDGSRREDQHDPGTVWVFSGKAGVVLDVLRGREEVHGPPPRFGFSLAALGDIDQDGVPDFAVGAYGDGERMTADVPPNRRGYARIYSGKTLQVLQEFVGEQTNDGFGCAVASAGDIDLDKIPDIAVGAPGSSDNELAKGIGYVRIFSGKNGSVFRTLRSTATRCTRFGFAVTSLGDVDLDGVPDLAVGIPEASETKEGPGSVEVFSGMTGVRLFSADGSGATGRRQLELGRAIAPLGDVNADGVPDFLTSRIDDSVRICSGKDGKKLRVIDDPGRYSYLRGFGDSLAALGDVNGDEVTDFAVGCEEQLDSGDQYDVKVFSGKDGTELRTLENHEEFVVVAATGDVDGDRVPDLLVGRWQSDAVDVISGRTWEAIRTIRRPKETR